MRHLMHICGQVGVNKCSYLHNSLFLYQLNILDFIFYFQLDLQFELLHISIHVIHLPGKNLETSDFFVFVFQVHTLLKINFI